jgi:hypothetical protein
MPMKTNFRHVLGLIGALFCGCVHPSEEYLDIDPGQIPAETRNVFTREFPRAQIVSSRKEVFQKKVIAYTVVFRDRDAILKAVTITPAGNVSRAVAWHEK